jgi:hypothetical protein
MSPPAGSHFSLWPKTGAVSQLPIACQLTVCVPVRGNWDVETKKKLQRLVAEHHELSKRISCQIKGCS